jgi:peptide deformylase
MPICRVLKYPNPVLRQVSQPVDWQAGQPWPPAIQQLLTDMTDTLYSHPGAIGLAAIQIGHPWRIFMLDMAAKTTQDQLMVLVNPVIVSTAKNKWVREGCLSFPEYLANVKRALKVTVTYYDQHAQPQTATLTDMAAVAVQHELDHLDGVLFIDRIQSLKSDLIPRQNNAISQDDQAS